MPHDMHDNAARTDLDERPGFADGRDDQEEPGFVAHPPRRHRRGQNIIIPIVAMTLAVVMVVTIEPHIRPLQLLLGRCKVTQAAAVVPQDGVLFGVNLDWKSETLAQHRENLGHAPAVAVEFSDIPYDRPTWEHTKSAARQVRENGGVLLLTLEPHAGLDAVSPEVIRTLAYDLLDLNNVGVAVIVRFAHEMNGSWYAWGQQPEHYKAVFRQVATAIHQIAPGSAMMWAPNYGGGYPFAGGKFVAKPGTENYRELDTDHDGQLSMSDDSYAPYYPGDEYVDWVGVSLYHWGNSRPWGNNDITEPHKFIDMLTGQYDGTAGDDIGVPNFYQVYGVEHHKPVAVVETAAIFTPSRTGQRELDIKRAWWRQVFSAETQQRFPQLKMINWFEWKKFEIEINDWVDWRAAGSSTIRDAFVADLPNWLRYADSIDACA
ncbi:MAG TPA: glycosyl hydrolase [Mycobacterium sp.]|nr:glycosyl hydrolase [Mycobacterium sp.]